MVVVEVVEVEEDKPLNGMFRLYSWQPRVSNAMQCKAKQCNAMQCNTLLIQTSKRVPVVRDDL